LKVIFDGKVYFIGNDRLAVSEGIEIPPGDEGMTSIHVLADKTYLGSLIMEDAIKEDSFEAIRRLHDDKVKVFLLSGDKGEVVKKVSDKLKLDGYFAESKPEDKVRSVEEAKSKGKTVAFAGDGMNDAAALASADVSIAMGILGSDAAIEAADVVLNHDNPLALSDAIRLSRRTMFVLKENLIFVMGVKVVVLILGSLGYASMGLAVFADVGVAILAILNAMRVVNGGNYALERH
jgi:Cd2+/Zn2+-exporting ATPase